MGGRGHLERAHGMGLTIDPVVILLGAARVGKIKQFCCITRSRKRGDRTVVQKGGSGTAPNPCRIIRSREDSALGIHLYLATP